MDRTALLEFIRSHCLAVQASVGSDGAPQSAVVGFAVSDNFWIVFDTVETSRKAVNLRHNQKVCFVIGGLVSGDERTVQYEGIADEPTGKELDDLKELYFSQFPDGKDRRNWEGLVYIRAKPLWIRYSDFNKNPPEITEFNFSIPSDCS